jgi:hypothetical protein
MIRQEAYRDKVTSLCSIHMVKVFLEGPPSLKDELGVGKASGNLNEETSVCASEVNKEDHRRMIS